MELRHLRYFVAAAEERSFVQAARRLRIAQPALSKQVRDLERELGVELLERLPRGVRLTPAGEAFLAEARITLEAAGRAVACARASSSHFQDLRFAHGELAAYTSTIEGLLAGFRDRHPDTPVRVLSQSDREAHRSLRARDIEVAAIFTAEWPLEGVEACRIIDCRTTGVLLPARHPLAAKPAVRLAELGTLTWLHSAPHRWPGFIARFEEALRRRGLNPDQQRPRHSETPASNLPIAAGETWALASEAIAAPYQAASQAIAYRPFVEPPIPCWIALVWLPDAAPAVRQLVEVAQAMGLSVDEKVGTLADSVNSTPTAARIPGAAATSPA